MTWRNGLSLAILFLLLAHPLLADTTWVSAGAVQGMWTPTRSPFMISSGDVDIPTGQSLTLLAGVEVIFTGPYRLTVHGALYGYGRDDDSIRFTTDTVANPARWRGIIAQSAACSLRFCIIENADGAAGLNGGGLSASQSRINLTSCRIHHNRSELAGGGVFGFQCSALNLLQCELTDNRASTGGAFYCRQTPATVIRSRIVDNQASVSGGGLYGTRSEWWVHRSWIADNRALTGDGGGIRSDSGNIRLFNSVVFRNRAAHDGGGFYSRDDSSDAVLFTNFIADSARFGEAIYQKGYYSRFGSCIVANCSGGIAVYFDQSPSIEFCYSNIYGNTGWNYGGEYPTGLGQMTSFNLLGIPCDTFMNISQIARFQDSANDNFHLMSNSPCIGSAQPSSVDNDLDGNPRPNPANSRPDIGAFESGEGVVAGTLSGNLRGILAPGIYTVAENVTVLTNDTLILQPGTRLLFGDECGMSVSGLLLAIGNEASPIIFSLLNDYPHGWSGWSGLRFVGCQQNCELTYCTIEQAHHGYNVECDACSPSLNHCLIQKGEGSYNDSYGLCCRHNASPVLTNCRITQNGVRLYSRANGGGVCSNQSSPSFINCRIDSNFALWGGGIFASGSTISLQGCNLDHNSAYVGSGCKFESSTVSIVNSSIDYNQYMYGGTGGGIDAESTSLTIRNTHIGHNANGIVGGNNFFSCNVVLDSTVIEFNNTRNGVAGCGIMAQQSTLSLSNCRIANNSAASGAGCQFDHCDAALRTTIIENNTAGSYASLGQGGGIKWVSDSAHTLTMDSCIIRNNHAASVGGGIEFSGIPHAAIRRCLFVGNLSSTNGGGINIENSANPAKIVVTQCTFFGNSLSGIVSADSAIEANSCVFAVNVNVGIYISSTISAARVIHDCDFSGNISAPIGGLPHLPVGLGTLSMTNVNGDSCDAFRNIFLNPAFVDTAFDNFHVNSWSPCIDAGDTLLPRDPDSSYADIGAYWQVRGEQPMVFDLVSPPDQSVWPTDIMRFSWQPAVYPDSQAVITYHLHLSIAGHDSTTTAISDTVAFVDIGAASPDSALVSWWVTAHCANPAYSTQSLTIRMLQFRPLRIQNFSLIAPANQDTVRSDTIRFFWSSSTSPRRPQTITYQLHLQGSGIDSIFPMRRDTSRTVVLGSARLPAAAWLQWHVNAYTTNPDSSFSSVERWNFYYDNPVAAGSPHETMPDRFELYTAYPNPFNAATIIAFDLPKPTVTRIQVFDITGRQVKILIDGPQAAGHHRIVFDGAGTASGIYFVCMDAGSFSQTQKMVLLK